LAADGLTHFNSIDGSTWDPFTGTLLFTQEASANGGVIEMGSDFDPNTGAGAGLRTLYGSLFFVITGDTDNTAGTDPVLAARGAWGGVFRWN
jgi:hypothetical protein